MPVKAPPIVAAVPYYNWSGFYIGVNAGWGWGDNDVTVAPSPDPLSQAFWNPAFAAGAAPSLFPLKQDGFFGGGQIGYNFQAGMFVFGVEADFQGSNIKDTLTINTAVVGFVPGFHTASQQLDWFGTLRGRLGVAAGSALLYVTGGLAYGQVQYGLSYNFSLSLDFQNLTAKNTEAGWTAGAGIEWGFAPNWSVKAEYLFVDLGDATFTTVGTGRPANIATSYTANYENQYHLARLGINYRFNWAAPLMARY